MNVELERELYKEFPALFRALRRRTPYDLKDLLDSEIRNMPLIQAFGIEHGDGWYGILRQLGKRIEAHCTASGMYAFQVKEKFGALCVYLGDMSSGDFVIGEEVDRAVHDAELESERVCEECGAPGSLRDEDGDWWRTRCDECDAPAKRFIKRTENIERFLHYIIRPETPEEASMWRRRLAGDLEDWKI